MRAVISLIVLFVTSCNSGKSDKALSYNPVKESFIISERIDGPANIRDTVNGRLLFTLNNNVTVSATEPQNKWLKIGVFADITAEQMESLSILKGSKIFVDGSEVGIAIDSINLYGAFRTNEGLKGELVGYTNISNIKPNTIPENVFSKIANNPSSALSLSDFKDFLKDYRFNEYSGLLPNLKGYEIDESWIEDPSAGLRLWLIFEGDKLFGIFHSRPMELKRAKTMKVEYGFNYSFFIDSEQKNRALIDSFNSYIVQVD